MENTPHAQATVECPPAKDPAVRWFIFATMMLGFAVWCYSDRRPVPNTWDFKHINEVAAYLVNNWGPVLLVPLGLLAAAMGLRHLSRKLVADDEGITYGRKHVAWNQVKVLDASKLQSKSILAIEYDPDGTMVLDSWRLQNFRQLVAFVEQRLPEDVQRRGVED